MKLTPEQIRDLFNSGSTVANFFIEESLKTESNNFEEIAKRLSDKRTIRLLHAALGLSTEANEFLDALKKWIFYGKELDEVNLAEEIGDLFWYQSIASDELGKSFEEIQIAVIQKLRKRYAEKFNSTEAIDRNVEMERAILEDNFLNSEGGILQELTENIVDRVKMEIIDDEENVLESNIPLRINGQDMVATIIRRLEDGSYETKMRLATEDDKIEYAEEFNEDRASENK